MAGFPQLAVLDMVVAFVATLLFFSTFERILHGVRPRVLGVAAMALTVPLVWLCRWQAELRPTITHAQLITSDLGLTVLAATVLLLTKKYRDRDPRI